LTVKKVSPDDQDTLIHSLIQNRTESLSKVDQAILAYAVKLTRTPHLVSIEDVGQLRKVGLDDRAIYDVCAITAYFAFVNRIADGLGVELEQRFG
jgi:uncharacterized peroxidase-related enzyme